MATGTMRLSTTSLGSLTAIQVTSALSGADVAAIAQSIADDKAIQRLAKAVSTGSTLQAGIIFGGATTTTLSTVTSWSLASPTTGLINAITAGQYIYGFGIAPGTRVLTTPAAGATSLTMSRAPLTGQSSGYFIAVADRTNAGDAFNSVGMLSIPNRGNIRALPGDYVCVGPSGEVFVLPNLAVTWPGSPWIFA